MGGILPFFAVFLFCFLIIHLNDSLYDVTIWNFIDIYSDDYIWLQLVF